MERGAVARWILWGLAAFILVTFVFPKACGNGDQTAALQPLSEKGQEATLKQPPRRPAEERLCDLWSPEFHAQLSSYGGALKHFTLSSAKYLKKEKGSDKATPIDVETTPDHPLYQKLRLDLRNSAEADGPNAQLDYDLVNWELRRADGKSCVFHYGDDKVGLERAVSVTGRPYELELKVKVTNRSTRKLHHAATVYTGAWRYNSETHSGMFGVSPFLTSVECLPKEGKATRLRPDDFKPEAFQKKEEFRPNAINFGDWYQVPGQADVAAVSNAYFTNAVVPVSGPESPVCQLQIESRGGAKDPRGGSFYRARLAYPPQTLEPGASREYGALAYAGPKERHSLAAAGGGQHRLDDLIDLGFFSAIAKVLVSFLLAVYHVIPNWGLAIILLTITARVLLFPLSIPSIKSMVKMRELQPEIDALNQKFKDDPQQRGLAQMELWRKHNVNPLKGCLPQLASMPVWFALYTTLQTAVELYNIPFLWFPDLSAPDGYYILPFIIGATSFVQQRMMPMTGGDPAQQKMMLYLMPGMFTVFMLFLPAGLGVYMFTNGLLGIIQQQTVQWHLRRTAKKPAAAAGEKGAPRGQAGPGGSKRSRRGSDAPPA